MPQRQRPRIACPVPRHGVHDSQVLEDLLHGGETKVWGDSAYQGQKEAMHKVAPNAQDMTNRRGSSGHPLSDADRMRNRTKSKVRARVEHVFHVMKRIFGFTMVRYRGIDKNGNRLFVTCALINIYMKRQFLMRRCTA
jgi:transposase, IS5 family